MTTKQLIATDDNIRSNQKSLIIHSLLLVLNCFAAIAYNMPYSKFTDITNIVLYITDMIIQLFICYICVTLGSSDDCYMIEKVHGGFELKFVLKEGVPEAIGVPDAAADVSE